LAIIKYAEKNIEKIITTDHVVTVKDVLNVYKESYPRDNKAKFISEYLNEYFKYRQERCQRDFNNNDYESLWDITEDKTENFLYLDKNLLSL
jgi:hypothetical protein